MRARERLVLSNSAAAPLATRVSVSSARARPRILARALVVAAVEQFAQARAIKSIDERRCCGLLSGCSSDYCA